MSELVDAGGRALTHSHWDGTGCGTHGSNACLYCFGPSPMSVYEIVETICSVIEPIIRADEQEKYKTWGPTVLSTSDQTPILADLRAKVEKLAESYPLFGANEPTLAGRAFTDVLALIDEA